MAVFVHNHSVASAADAWYAVKAQMLLTAAAGRNWELRTSGSGTGGVYSQAGDVVQSSAVLGNDLAWFVVTGHGVLDAGAVYKRELCFQISQPSGQVRITYSARAGFKVGSPSPTRVPSATDQVTLLGGGTDAAPTFAPLLPTSGAWLQARFSEGDDGFWVLTYPIGGGLPTALLYLDPIPPQYKLGGELVDHDPAVLYARQGADCCLFTVLASEVTGPMGWLDLTDPAGTALWARLPAGPRYALASTGAPAVVMPSGLPASPHFTTPVYAQDVMRYSRRVGLAGTLAAGEAGAANTCGDKGEGALLRWSGTRFATATVLDDVDPSTGALYAKNILAAGDLQLPWELGASVAQ